MHLQCVLLCYLGGIRRRVVFCFGEYIPGNVMLCLERPLSSSNSFWVGSVHLMIFSWISSSKLISHFVDSFLIFLIVLLLFIQNVKPYFSEGVVSCFRCLPSCRNSYPGIFAKFLLEVTCLNEECILECLYSLPENEENSEQRIQQSLFALNLRKVGVNKRTGH